MKKLVSYRTASYEAANVVRGMINRGELVSLSKVYVKCSDCPKRATVYDHRDYQKPKDVEPVCRSCNAVRGRAKYPHLDIINCPECNSKNIIIDKKWGCFCRRCGHAWPQKRKAAKENV